MRTKIAVFVSGPVRFVDLVRQNIGRHLAGVDHDYFYHLWLQDLGNKVRHGYQSDPVDLLKQGDTKTLLFQQPYQAEFFTSTIGTQANTHSSVNAVIGMFLGLAQLCEVFSTLPDRAVYTHILRIRTDCAVTGDGFLEALDLSDNTVTMSGDPGLPRDGWVSDHLLFAPVELFLRLYKQENIENIYRVFDAGQRNPEKMLKHLLDTRLPAETKLNPAILRYRHYQIVYSPPRPTDQLWMRALIESGRIPDIFLHFSEHRRSAEDDKALNEQALLAPKRDLYRSPFLNRIREWKKRFLG